MMYTITVRVKPDKQIDIVTDYQDVTFVCRMLDVNPHVIEYVVSNGGHRNGKGEFVGGKYLEKFVMEFDYTRR